MNGVVNVQRNNNKKEKKNSSHVKKITQVNHTSLVTFWLQLGIINEGNSVKWRQFIEGDFILNAYSA